MSIKRLSSFVKFLEEKAGFKFNLNLFDHRLKLQKYVYIGKLFGLPLSYSYNIYLRGPYSPDLALDYYRLANTPSDGSDYDRELGGFDANGFLKLVKGQDADWLEVAATMLSIHSRYRSMADKRKLKEIILAMTKDIKSFIPNASTVVENVFGELSKRGLIEA